MKKKSYYCIIITLFFLAFNSAASAQFVKNSMYFELFGNGGLYSINYDRLFSENFGGRIGFSHISNLEFIFSSVDNITIIPITLNYLTSSDHKFELGAGIAVVNISGGEIFGFKADKGASGVVGTGTIGYRYQPDSGGFLFRIGLTPFFAQDGFQISGGISLGAAF